MSVYLYFIVDLDGKGWAIGVCYMNVSVSNIAWRSHKGEEKEQGTKARGHRSHAMHFSASSPSGFHKEEDETTRGLSSACLQSIDDVYEIHFLLCMRVLVTFGSRSVSMGLPPSSAWQCRFDSNGKFECPEAV